jgi:hypothetical protein
VRFLARQRDDYGGTVGIGRIDEACGVGARGIGGCSIRVSFIGPNGLLSPEESAIAATIVAIGSSGMHAIATRTLGILHVIHEAAIETMHATGNARKAKTISHTSGFALEPGASKAIGAPATAIKKPGTMRMPQTVVATIARIGRGVRSLPTVSASS